MVISRLYRYIKWGDKLFYVQSLEECVTCPICGGTLGGYGTRNRGVVDIDYDKKTLIIRRLKCPVCGKTHSELPDDLIPYKRHCAKTIVGIIEDSHDEELVREASYVYKVLQWWGIMLGYFMGVLGSLTAKFGVDFGPSPKTREIVRAVANSHRWKSTRSVLVSG